MTTNPAPGSVSCPCGCPWFVLETATGAGGVAFDERGGVVSFYGLPVCSSCGRAIPEITQDESDELFMAMSPDRHLQVVREEQE